MKTLAERLLEHRLSHGAGSPEVRIWANSDDAFYRGAAAMAELFTQGDLLKALQELAANGGERAQTSCWIDGIPTASGWYVTQLTTGDFELLQIPPEGSETYLKEWGYRYQRFFGFKLP